jgi:DHA1 family bicyclomycin/chloramphenicol resistance-like MFS transporter
MTPLAGIGIDLYTPSLPAITNYFGASESLVKLTIAFYLLGYGVGQPFFGTLSDCYGRKKLLYIGMIFFAVASFIAVYSSSIHVLLVMRFIQGIGAASSGVIAKSLVTDSFTGNEINKASTYMSVIWGLGPIVAPAVGGYLQYYFGWTSSFYLLALYGVAVFILSLLLLPETNRNLLTLNMRSIFESYKKTLTHLTFLGSIIGMAIVYSIITIFSVVAPFLIQQVLHFSPIAYGNIALVMGVAYFAGSLFNRFLIGKLTIYRIIFLANLISLIVGLLMAFLSLRYAVNIWHIVVPTFIIFFCGGIIFPNCMTICLSLFVEIAGTASAVMGFLFVIGTSIVSAVASFLETTSLFPLAISYLLLIVLNLILCATFLKRSDKLELV